MEVLFILYFQLDLVIMYFPLFIILQFGNGLSKTEDKVICILQYFWCRALVPIVFYKKKKGKNSICIYVYGTNFLINNE